ncbi:uncharacterized protein LOC136714939 [Amia ocellicauda]|uniref:uncharacterized protein LOC136714939 n=1 Tax=Amia ocellicauda TaxID=2972642 RepID=UPI003463F1A5
MLCMYVRSLIVKIYVITKPNINVFTSFVKYICRIEEKEHFCSGWQVFDEGDHSIDEIEFHGIQKPKLVGKLKCRSLDENNIVISPHLLTSCTEAGSLSEELQTTRPFFPVIRSSCPKTFSTLNSKQLRNTPSTGMVTNSFHSSSSVAPKEQSGKTCNNPAFNISQVKRFISLTHSGLSTPFMKRAAQSTISRDFKVTPHHLLSAADHTLQQFKMSSPKETSSTEQLDRNQTMCSTDEAWRKARSGMALLTDDIRALGRTSQRHISVLLGMHFNEGCQVENCFTNSVSGYQTSSYWSPNCQKGLSKHNPDLHYFQFVSSPRNRLMSKSSHPNEDLQLLQRDKIKRS